MVVTGILFFLFQVNSADPNEVHQTGEVPHSDPPDGNSDFEKLEKPLYEGSKITLCQGLLLLISFIIRHALTKAAVEDLLSLVNLFTPIGVAAAVPPSRYLFYKELICRQMIQLRSIIIVLLARGTVEPPKLGI